jgi:hypothetical protein
VDLGEARQAGRDEGAVFTGRKRRRKGNKMTLELLLLASASTAISIAALAWAMWGVRKTRTEVMKLLVRLDEMKNVEKMAKRDAGYSKTAKVGGVL